VFVIIELYGLLNGIANTYIKYSHMLEKHGKS